MATQEERDLQNQIYIISSVFGGVCFFLICITIFMLTLLYRLKGKVEKLRNKDHGQAHGQVQGHGDRGGHAGGGGGGPVGHQGNQGQGMRHGGGGRYPGPGQGAMVQSQARLGQSNITIDELEQRGFSAYPGRGGGGSDFGYQDQYRPASSSQSPAGVYPGRQGNFSYDNSGYDHEQLQEQQQKSQQDLQRNMLMTKMDGKMISKGFNKFGNDEDLF